MRCIFLKSFRYLIVGGFFISSFAYSPECTAAAQQPTRLIAYIVLSTECPVSQQIIPTINDLKKNYRNVKFVAVFTAWDNRYEINSFKKKYKLTTAIIHDKKHKLINSLSASITPEAFLFTDTKQLIFHGVINDQFIALGKRK